MLLNAPAQQRLLHLTNAGQLQPVKHSAAAGMQYLLAGLWKLGCCCQQAVQRVQAGALQLCRRIMALCQP